MKKIVDFINAKIRHVRDKAGDYGIRTVLHIPVGIVMGLSIIPCDKLVDLFIYYEKNEDFHTKDQAWKDVNGALVGFCIGRLIVTAGVIAIVIILICLLR